MSLSERLLPLLLVCLVSCGTSKTGFNDSDASTAGADGGPVLQSDGGTQQAIGHLKGTVLAPNGLIPVSGALVYVAASAPEAIPDGVYCDKCATLPQGTSYVFSSPNGDFDLPVFSAGKRTLVVQKGSFRRVRSIDVAPGDTSVPADFATFPKKMDKAAGDDIPKMAVVLGAWDKIEATLAKLGLGTITSGSNVDLATASFAAYGFSFPPKATDLDPQKLLSDPAEIDKYQIVFIPCSGGSAGACGSNSAGDANVKANLARWVQRGGKLYVTDYSYDYARQPFPGFVDWHTDGSGSVCLSGQYDSPGKVDDKGLEDWLTATGVGSVELKANWTAIKSLNPTPTTDPDGNPVTVTPKTWMTSTSTPFGARPATISFDKGCGRVLFSTYHTEADLGGPAILPQEKALLYVLLEVGVCFGSVSVR